MRLGHGKGTGTGMRAGMGAGIYTISNARLQGTRSTE